MDSDPTDLEALARVNRAFVDACMAIQDRQWNLPTPCSDWTLRQLVDHVIGGNRFTILILGGASGQDALAAAVASFDREDNAISSAAISASEQLKAFRSPGVLDAACHHLDAVLTGREILRIRIHELIVHTWDILETIGPPALIHPESINWAIGELDRPDSLTIERFGLTPLAAPLDRQTGQEALLAAFGRTK